MHAGSSSAGTRRLAPMMRLLYLGVAALVVFIGLSLFVLTEDTDSAFAWTIAPPITAAFLGAGYWSGLPLLIVSARERVWANARVAVPVALTLDLTLTAATFIHLDRFHTDTVIGWVWIISYCLLPPSLVIALVRQLREPGGDPPRAAPIGGWMRVLLGVQAAVMLALGAALFVAPGEADALWPWQLTPLTGRAIGGMILTHGVGVTAVLLEGAWERVLAPMITYTALGLLHVVVLIRYGDALDWGAAGSWLYLAFVIGVLGAAAYGWRAATVARRAPAQAFA